jgi:hypothetical protein
MDIMASDPIITAYFINISRQPCICMRIPPIVARQRPGKHVSEATNSPNNRKIDGLVIFYEARVLSKEICRSVYHPIVAR